MLTIAPISGRKAVIAIADVKQETQVQAMVAKVVDEFGELNVRPSRGFT